MYDLEKTDQIIMQTLNEQLQRIKIALSDRNLSKVATQTALHENTVRAIASGKNVNPSIETIKKLSEYLFGGQRKQ